MATLKDEQDELVAQARKRANVLRKMGHETSAQLMTELCDMVESHGRWIDAAAREIKLLREV